MQSIKCGNGAHFHTFSSGFTSVGLQELRTICCTAWCTKLWIQLQKTITFHSIELEKQTISIQQLSLATSLFTHQSTSTWNAVERSKRVGGTRVMLTSMVGQQKDAIPSALYWQCPSNDPFQVVRTLLFHPTITSCQGLQSRFWNVYLTTVGSCCQIFM